MKKSFFILILTLMLVMSLVNIRAETPLDSVGTNLEQKVNSLNDIGDKINDPNARTEYLKQEWTKILEKYQSGRIILGIGKVLSSLNPIFNFFIGIEYSPSWLFVLSLFTWIFMLNFFYQPIKDFFDISKIIAFLMSLVISGIAAQFSIIPKIMSFFVPLFTNQWIIWLAILIAIAIMYIYSFALKKIGKSMKESSKKENESRREQKAELTEKINDIKIKSSK